MHWCVSHHRPIWRGLLRKTENSQLSRLTHISEAAAQGTLALRGQAWTCPPSPAGLGSARFLTAFSIRVHRPPPQSRGLLPVTWVPTLPPSCLLVEASALEANICPNCSYHSPTQISFVPKPDHHSPIISVPQEGRWSGFLG